MQPKIIGIVAPIRAGKSLAAKYLNMRYGYSIGANSQILKEIASNLSLPHTRENLKALGDSIFKVLGNDAIAMHRMRNSRDWPIVIEGIRYIEEVRAYRAERSFKLIGLKSSEDARYARALALAHEGKDQNLDLNAFRQLSVARSEAQVTDLVKGADFIINNESTIDDFHRQIDQIMTIWTTG